MDKSKPPLAWRMASVQLVKRLAYLQRYPQWPQAAIRQRDEQSDKNKVYQRSRGNHNHLQRKANGEAQGDLLTPPGARNSLMKFSRIARPIF